MSAVITNKQLLRTENNLTKSMERLSSGLKINHAKDNPAGMAISNKMKTAVSVNVLNIVLFLCIYPISSGRCSYRHA